jgi:hypothetical protein
MFFEKAKHARSRASADAECCNRSNQRLRVDSSSRNLFFEKPELNKYFSQCD